MDVIKIAVRERQSLGDICYLKMAVGWFYDSRKLGRDIYAVER